MKVEEALGRWRRIWQGGGSKGGGGGFVKVEEDLKKEVVLVRVGF